MPTDLTTAEANRLFYRDVARRYDETADCLTSLRRQDAFRSSLDQALALAPDTWRTLDLCGGTGNVGRVLLEHGIAPVVVDISKEMVDIWRERSRRYEVEPEVHVSEATDFLARDEREWDLITLSSALHHLEDYEEVLKSAIRRLAPDGVIFTAFDPTRSGTIGRRLRRADWLLWTLLRHPTQLRALLGRWLRRLARPSDESLYIARKAERYAQQGIDDLALARLFERCGLVIHSHERTYDARLAVTRLAFRALRMPSNFEFIVQKPGASKTALGDSPRSR